MSITFSECTDVGMMQLCVKAAAELTPQCKTAIVILTSACKLDGHGNHVTVSVLNQTGKIDPREAGSICRRLRSLADELETRFGSDDGSN